MSNSRLTIKSYYKHFLSVYGLLAALIGGIPFLSKLLPEDWAQYMFPPLGTWETFYRAVTLILAGGITLVVYSSKDRQFISSKRGRTKALGLFVLIILIGLLGFFILTQRFVRSLYVPSVKKTIVASVGYERTDFTRSTFDNASDEELLKARGVTEEEIQRLWTSKSITWVRVGLFISYLVLILSMVAFISLVVLFDKSGLPPNP